MDDMRSHVLNSFRSGVPGGGLPRACFLLDPAARDEPTSYQIDLILDGVRHQYGFTLSDQRVLEEFAFRYPNGKAALIFDRTLNEIKFPAGERSIGRAVQQILRPNALFLSTAAATEHPQLLPLYGWFSRNLRLAEAASRSHRWAFTAAMMNNVASRDQILAFISAADLGITNANVKELDGATRERYNRAFRIFMGVEEEASDAEIELTDFMDPDIVLTHRGMQGDIQFDTNIESLGTLVWLGLAGAVVDALNQGSVLLADELESSLHPMLVAHLVKLFQNPQTNPRRAQLIFNSHEALLLGYSRDDRVLGRDQVWLSEKSYDGSTRLFPLSDLSPRRDEPIARRYLAGRYGGVPILAQEEFDALTDRTVEEQLSL
jgi:hypothetical protein